MSYKLPDIFKPRGRAAQPQHVNRVSGIGHPCVLSNWFRRAYWQMRKPPDETLLRIFKEGDHWHARAAAAFLQHGVQYIRQEEAMFWPDLNLSGHMDGYIPDLGFIDPALAGQSAVVDVKGMSDYAFDSIDSLEYLRQSDKAYHRQYVVQPALYAVHEDVEADWCIIYKIRRSSGATGQIWWQPSDVVEEIVAAKQACRDINEAMENPARDDLGNLIPPAQLATQGSWCDDCDFQTLCPEYSLMTKGIVIAPQEVIDLVDRKLQLDPVAREHRKVSDQLKDYWKRAGAGTYLCGDSVAYVKEIAAKDVPAKPAFTKPAYLRTTYKPADPDTGKK